MEQNTPPATRDRSGLLTEMRLPESKNLDAMSAAQIVALMNAQDAIAVAAVASVAAEVAKAATLVAKKLAAGGRLIYAGAGTSGRLGVLDASECPPTFRSDPAKVIGLIAGGESAMFRAQEFAEDSPGDGMCAMRNAGVNDNDAVCGIAAGGTTPYVTGAIQEAHRRGAATIFLTCVAPFAGQPPADVAIHALTGPEVLTGSTRLKAGTATKLILNQLTTIAFVHMGKCYENLMVDLRCTNEKLWDRGARIVATVCDVPKDVALAVLHEADGHVKKAIVMQRLNCDEDAADDRLHEHHGRLRETLGTV